MKPYVQVYNDPMRKSVNPGNYKNLLSTPQKQGKMEI